MSGPLVVGLDEQDEPIEIERWTELARRVLGHEGIHDGEMNLLFVTTETMTELNREHMAESGPTDVLSFPIDAGDDASPGGTLLGDVVICPEVAAGQAAEHRAEGRHEGTADDEIALLVVHGVLHVLGHDHAEPDEAELMRTREQELLGAYHRR